MRQWIVGAFERPITWLALLAAWLTLSALRSFHTLWAQAALTEWLRWAAGITLALTIAYARPSALFLARTALILVASIVVLAISRGLISGSGGLAGPFLDHQLCGSALLILLPWTIALAFRDPNSQWRWAAQSGAIAGLVCLAFSLTRSAWAGAVMATLCTGVYGLTRIQHRANALRIGIVAIGLALGICMGFVLAAQPTELSAKLDQRTATLRAVSKDNSWQNRQIRWQGTIRMAKAHPFLGWGLGRYPGLQSNWTGQGRILGPNIHPGLSEQAHNFYLQTAAETGIIGLLLYLGVLLAAGISCFRACQSCSVRREPLRSALLLAGLSTLIGQAVDALASPSWQYGEVSLFWWAGIGLIMQLVRTPLASSAQLLPAIMPKQRRFLLMTSSAFIAPLIVGLFQPSLLLLPAEAYTAPTGWTYVGPPIFSASSTSVSVGDQVTLRITALYRNINGSTANFTVSDDGMAKYTPSVHHPVGNTSDSCIGDINGNVFTIPPSCTGTPTSGNTITVLASFKDGINHPAANNIMIAVK